MLNTLYHQSNPINNAVRCISNIQSSLKSSYNSFSFHTCSRKLTKSIANSHNLACRSSNKSFPINVNNPNYKRLFGTATQSQQQTSNSSRAINLQQKKSEFQLPPDWKLVVGIEVHAQILTNSKLFSTSSTQFGSAPNSNCNIYDLASPGALPLINKNSIMNAILTGLGINGEIQLKSMFERKHYFYCDMPNGYQITQRLYPIVKNGYILLPSHNNKKIRVARIQLEQDSGKSIHDLNESYSFIDLNRAGSSLMEIVSEPDINTISEANEYMRELTKLLRLLNTSDAAMEKGSLRADINISVNNSKLNIIGERVEIKNLNSLKSLTKVIEIECMRQINNYINGIKISKETRGFDAKLNQTYLLRSKEDQLDYRFIPDPDLPPLILSNDLINNIKSRMPELPQQLMDKLTKLYGFTNSEVNILLQEPGALNYFTELVKDKNKINNNDRSAKKVYNWIINELLGKIKNIKQTQTNIEESIDNDDDNELTIGASGSRSLTLLSSPVSILQLGEIIDLVESNTINGKVAKQLLMQLMQKGMNNAPLEELSPIKIVDRDNLSQINDEKHIEKLCSEVIGNNPNEVNEYLAHNKKMILSHLNGLVIKNSSGRANPVITSKIMEKLIEKQRKR